jgi:hypothetical protein
MSSVTENGRPGSAVREEPEPHLHAVPARPVVDLDAAERAARDLLLALGADLEAAGLRETPRRIAGAYGELLTPLPFNATTFPNEESYDELVVVRDIPFQSLCMHHLLPFHGVAHASAICPPSGSLASRSSAASLTSSRAICSSRSASRRRSRTGSTSSSLREESA